MEQTTYQRGQAGEAKALEYLERRGYRLLARNFRWRRGEGDLIMEAPDGAVVLVEVRSAAAASPWLRFSVGPGKVRRLKGTLDYFLRQLPGGVGRERRIEFIWIEGETLEHWKNPL